MLMPSANFSHRGFALLEALIAIVVLAVGLLGMAKLQVSSRQYEMESYQRAQAVILLQDMVSRLTANRYAAACYAVTTSAVDGTPWLGVGYSSTPACSTGTTTQQTAADTDVIAWDQLLKGASETNAGTNVGAMIGARGCVQYDAVTDQYVVTVAWQGLMQTAAPASGLTCGKDQYGNETQRRAVSAVVKLATLT
jgi:type IV pilus assembly protein PilV